MEAKALLQQLNESGQIQLRSVVTMEELEAVLAQRIGTLMQKDPEGLLQLLYRIDVDEKQALRVWADASAEEAARVISRLILERQWQKIETRRRYRQEPGDEEERW